MTTDYINLNALVSLKDPDGNYNTDWDKEAARQYFLQHVNENTVFFHNLEEKLEYLIKNGYYEEDVFTQFPFEAVKLLYKRAYGHKFRFQSFIGALKFYSQYALKNTKGDRYLERYEDRVVAVALGLCQLDYNLAEELVDTIITGQFQPATPTFLNTGKAKRGELTSCFLLQVQDNMESISKAFDAALQLSKRGGGVAFCLSNVRASGDPIKGMEGKSSGVIPIMKILEDSFSYANQLGARQGSGAVYLHAHHPDILKFIDTKRENADEKVRIKTLSVGVVVPDITFELAKNNEDMFLFSPHDVEKELGKPFGEISVTENYEALCNNPKIKKTKISAREFFTRIAEVQVESGYPYVMFEDNANRQHVNEGWLNMSNLCVAPETLILTKEGYLPIHCLKDTEVEVWNGEEWSNTTVRMTSPSSELIRVHFSDGSSLDCTPEHHFYIKENYRKNAVKVAAKDLKFGDKLEKFNLPTDVFYEGEILVEDKTAYSHGFYAGDGNEGCDFSWVYSPKADCIPRLVGTFKEDLNNGRYRWDHGDFLPKFGKFTVPFDWCEAAKITWLSGLFDADACVVSSTHCENIQLCSVNTTFLHHLKLFLQELGVHSSVSLRREEGKYLLPKNDGSGECKYYDCKGVWMLNINGTGVKRLVDLGLSTLRCKVKGLQEPNRDARRFVTVENVEVTGRISPTFCFTESKRNKGMFNGVLTGQCVEIMQYSEASTYNEDGSYSHVGRDISCNLGSLNIANVMDSGDLPKTVQVAIRALTNVTQLSNLKCVPSIQRGNAESRSIGLGQMNLHGFLAREGIEYGTPEALEFVDLYFRTVNYWALTTSWSLAHETGKTYKGFEKSKYATGEYFDKYLEEEVQPELTKDLCKKFGLEPPTVGMWETLKEIVMVDGLHNAYLQAVPPTGSISYINHSTASIHPVTSQVETRKEGLLGRVYYPMPYLSKETQPYYTNAYDLGWKALIDTYAAAQKHVDQSLSLTVFLKSGTTTREINQMQIYAWKKGIKTLYYVRLQQPSEELGSESCEACVL